MDVAIEVSTQSCTTHTTCFFVTLIDREMREISVCTMHTHTVKIYYTEMPVVLFHGFKQTHWYLPSSGTSFTTS